MRNRTIHSSDSALVFLVDQDRDLGIFALESSQGRQTAIGRSVIRNDNFVWPDRLGEQRCQRAFQKTPMVVRRKYNADSIVRLRDMRSPWS